MKPTILIFRQSDGTFGFAPKAAMQNPAIAKAFRYSDEPGFQTIAEARAHIATRADCRKCRIEEE